MADPNQVFVEVEVDGDGNCFYRSLYKSAKYHPDASVFNNVLNCFHLDLAAVASVSNSNSSVSSTKGKSKSKTKKLKAKKAKSDETEENAFCTAIRHALAERIIGTALMDGTYAALTEAAGEAIGGEEERWEQLIDAAADEIAEEYEDPAVFISTSADEFKEKLAEIVRMEGVYASQLDYEAVKTILASCEIKLISAEGRPRRAADITELRTADADGRPVLMVRRMKAADHYRAYLTEEQFKAHKDEISPKPKSSVAKVSIAKFRKTLKAPKAAPRGPSNNNENSNFEAALAASLKNM